MERLEFLEKLVAFASITTADIDLEQALHNSLKAARDFTSADSGSLFLLDKTGRVREALLSRGIVTPVMQKRLVNTVLDKGLAGHVMRSRQTVSITDTRTDDRWFEFPNQPYIVRSALGVPIIRGEELLAILTLSHSEPEHFTPEHIELIEAGAGYLALALDHARAHADVKHELEQRKIIEKDLAQARDQALAASKFKSEILANVSHEIRTPIHGIAGMTELLLKTSLNEVQLDYAQTILHSTNILLVLINDILDISQIEANKLTLNLAPFDLAAILERTEAFFRWQAQQKGLKLVSKIESQVKTLLQGDALRLQQVLINLLSNALKFTQEGEVELKVKLTEQSQETVTLNFMVKDSGIGISPEVISRLFEPFTQADSSNTRRYSGTGLGLAISQRLVQMMGGLIKVESQVGIGSTFSFSLTFPRVHYSSSNLSQSTAGVAEFPVDLQYKNGEKGQSEILVPPPAEELHHLLELALRGNMSRIQQYAHYLENLSPQYRLFARQICYLAEAFEDKELQKLIERYL